MAAHVDDSSNKLNSQHKIHRSHIKYRPSKVQQIRTDAEAKLNKYDMPFFRYHLLDMKNIHFRWITDGVEQIHHITDTDKFYRLLGYTEEMHQSDIEPEVFVWELYHKDNSLKAEVCLQANLLKYLNQHSQKFITKYAAQYTSAAGSCTSNKINDSTDCISCHMHPPTKSL